MHPAGVELAGGPGSSCSAGVAGLAVDQSGLGCSLQPAHQRAEVLNNRLAGAQLVCRQAEPATTDRQSS